MFLIGVNLDAHNIFSKLVIALCPSFQTSVPSFAFGPAVHQKANCHNVVLSLTQKLHQFNFAFISNFIAFNQVCISGNTP
jgi:hypothetical protein